MSIINLRFIPVCGVLLASGFPGPLMPPAFGQAVLEEIIVTARKTEESAQTVPVAVSAFSGAFLEERQSLTLEDLEGLAPNLLVDPVYFQSGGASLTIRGIGVSDIDRTFSPGVQVVVDGVTFGSSVANQMLNILDVERLEVLRGPQGTVFGANAIGGVINVTRRKPSGEFGIEGRANFGENSRKDFHVAVEAPLIEDVLAARLYVADLEDDGRFKNVFNGEDRGFRDFTMLSPSIHWTLSESFEATLTYDYYDNQSDWGIARQTSGPTELLCLGLLYPEGALFGAAVGEPFCEDPSLDLEEVNQDHPTMQDVDLNAVTMHLKYELDSLTFESITGWSRVKENRETDFDGVPVPVFAAIQFADEESLSQEFRVNYDHSESVNVLFGIYGSFSDWLRGHNSLYVFDLFGFPPETTEVVSREQETKAYGVFANANIAFNEQWEVSVGGRYAYDKKEFIYRNGYNQIGGGFWPHAPGFNNFAAGTESWTEFTPKVSVQYYANDDLMLYASFSEGFKSGGFNGRGNSQDTIGPYDPELVDAWEVGVKSEWWDNRFRLNAVFFTTDYQDKQEEIIRNNPDTGATITAVDNAGDVEIDGVEVDWTLLPFAGMTLSGSIGYLDGKYNEFVSDGVDNADFVILRRAPEWTYSVTAQYAVALGDGEFKALLSWRSVDEYQSHLGPGGAAGGTLFNDPRGWVDPDPILDASVTYTLRFDEHEVYVSAWGKNITDEVYINGHTNVGTLWAMGSVHPGSLYGVEVGGRW